MGFFLLHFRSGLRAQLRSWRSWLLLLSLPLAVLGLRSALPARSAAAPVQVGVVLPAQGGEEFWRKLDGRGGLVVAFLPAGEDEARRQVAAGRWDCALLLPEDFAQRLERRDSYHIFTLLTGPGSTAYPLVRETTAACLSELLSPGLAEDYLVGSGILDPEEAQALRPRLRETLSRQERVLVSLETVDGAPLDPIALAEGGVEGLLAGLVALVLTVRLLFTAMDLHAWLESPFARRLLPLRGRFALLLPRLLAALVPPLCSGALALLALAVP